jgi:adenosine deaminase
MKVIQKLHKTFAPETILLPELTFARDDCDVDYEYSLLDEILSYKFFKSIDVCGDENAQSIKNFKKIFCLAKSYDLILKAHVGEFGRAEDIKEAVEELNLSEVHHGNTASTNPQIMRWLADNKIQLNICPASNIMLGLVENYSTHPIKNFYEAGIPVTINTDDLLIFNQTISQEYLNLFNAKLFTANELNEIRETGISILSRYKQNQERLGYCYA